MSVEEWVFENCERLQQLRDSAPANYHAVSEKRKHKLDSTCHVREFIVGDKVWYRIPGLSESLQPSWQGPYKIDKVLGCLSYRIDMNGKLKNVHINFIKQFAERKDSNSTMIKRITTVLDDDCVGDDVTCTNDKVQLQEVAPSAVMKEDIGSWLRDFKDIVRVEPGLTNWVELSINMGDAPPVAQRPYNTPLALREAVEKKVNWLLEKGYIRESQSKWASPIVTVKKPDRSIRLCIGLN